MTKGPGSQVSRRVADLRARGVDALESLPDRKAFAAKPRKARHEVLDGLRAELYALTALLADDVLRRAYRDRASYPPYGLGKSMFATWGMLKVFPEPYEDGSITSFFDLWKGFVDTTVLHLHRELGEERHSDDAWRVERLDALLPLFLTVANTRTTARLRDTQTFLYGGLQFGTSVCVQMTEAMARLLQPTTLSPAGRSAVIARSAAPALRLAAMNLDHALPTYRGLLSTARDTPSEGRKRPGWLDAGRFTIQEHDGAPYSVGLGDREADRGTTTTYTTLGCPARIPTGGEDTPITALWRWCVDVAHDAGLLDPPAG